MKSNQQLLKEIHSQKRKVKGAVNWKTLAVAALLSFSYTQTFAGIQGHIITLNYKKARLEQVLGDIQKQTGYEFLYETSLVKSLQNISVNIKNEKFETFLKSFLAENQLDYTIEDNTVYIIEKKTVDKSTNNGKSNIAATLRQQNQLSGRVVNELGQALAGVTVTTTKENIAVSTDLNGQFKVALNQLPQHIKFSAMGYEAKTMLVEQNQFLTITLQTSVSELNEVIVVGYGTQLKRDLTGSVGKVKGEDLKNMPVRGVAEALQGQAAGVQVTSTGGSPGAAPSVRIRGIGTVNDNNPLYVVDGLPQNDIAWLNPNDIESLEILKDASASAIYGSRAANGVIMVTTAKGKGVGDKLTNQLSFDSYVGFQNPVKVYEMMNASEFMDYKNLANTNAGLSPYFSDQDKKDVLKFLKSNTGSEEGTNWWKQINNKDAVIQNYDFAISGGMKDLAYRTSVSYLDQDGIIKGSDYDRLSIRGNVDHTVRDWLKFSGNLGVITEGRGNVLENSPGFNTAFIAFVADPLSPVYRNNLKDIPSILEPGLFLDRIDANNSWNNYSPILMTNKANPVAQTEIYKNNRWTGTAIKGGASVDIKLTDWLKFRSNFGADISSGISNSFQPKYYLNGNQFNVDATVGAANSKSNYYVWENTLTFEKKFDDHHVSALLGTSAEEWKSEYSAGSRSGLISNDPSQWIIDGGSINPQASGSKWESALNSYFSRIFYSYKNRYMVTANIRRDGSSSFAEGEKWGTFPSISAGWNFSEEEGLKNSPWLSSGKLRMSWGKIGNQNISRGAYLTTYSGNMGYYLFGNYNPQLIGGSNYIGNSAIQWEETEQMDIGVDLSFFQKKLNLTVDAYQKTTNGMLLNVPLPSYLGFPNSPWSNAGSVRNSGLEVDLSYRDKVGDFGYSISGNVSSVKNKVLSLGGGEPIAGGGWISYTTTLTQENMPIGYFYGFKTDGIFQNQAEIDSYVQTGVVPGDLRFVDVNNDGVINSEDRTRIGDPFPSLIYGLRLGGDYKNFDLQILAQGTLGNDIMNIKKIDMNSGVGWYNAPKDFMEQAWSPTNPSQEQFKISASNQSNLQISDWLVEDGSYLRIKSVQLGYNFPQQTLTKIKLQKLRIWAGGYNLFTFTKYKGLDPEIGSGSPLSMGVDQGYYPAAKSFMFGINVSF